MKNIKKLASFKRKTISKCIAFSLLMIAASQASALDVSLCAGETEKMMADGTSVKVWGYGLDNPVETAEGTCTTATVPGPQLTVPVGDTALNVTLRNTLSDAVSVMIPGMKGITGNTPVFFNDGTFYADGVTPRMRVQSLVAETATGASTLYSFTAKAGTHLYQSGTHPAVQVQMGLYGATTQDAATGEAYPGVTYDNDVVMLYSEIDPAMHDAIAGSTAGAAATYGTPGGPSSTVGYKARYYLVNGESFTAATANLSVGNKGERVLIRFLNAGLESHVPVLQGKHMSMVAEYGHAYPFAREQYSVLLAAGATKDAVFAPSSAGDYPLYDRRLRLTNSAQAGDGGLMRILSVTEPAPPANAAVANADSDSTAEDTAVLIDVLFNDANAVANSIEIASQPTNGSAAVDVTNTVLYMPNANFNGSDAFSYTVRNVDGVISNTAAVIVSVTPENDAPVGVDDSYNATASTVLAGNVLTNDTDIDGDALSATAATSIGTFGTFALNADGSFTYTPGAIEGTDIFTYSVTDGTLSATATVTINVTAAVNIAPVAVDDYVTVTRNTGATNNFVTIVVSANDTDADGTVDPLTVAIDANPLNGTAVVDAVTGNITYTPRAGFRGSDAFSYTINDNGGATSNAATVRVDVIR